MSPSSILYGAKRIKSKIETESNQDVTVETNDDGNAYAGACVCVKSIEIEISEKVI